METVKEKKYYNGNELPSYVDATMTKEQSDLMLSRQQIELDRNIVVRCQNLLPEPNRSVHFVEMSVVLKKNMLRKMRHYVADLEFETKLALYAKRNGLNINTINRSEIPVQQVTSKDQITKDK